MTAYDQSGIHPQYQVDAPRPPDNVRPPFYLAFPHVKTARVAPPSGIDFAALARSSPWRWTTLRFTARWPGDPWRRQELRAWLGRPNRLRVETVDGVLVQVLHESTDRYTETRPSRTAPETPRPRLRADGLVAARPDRFLSTVGYDAPMYRDYFWVAMLDPAELADGRDPATGATVAGTAIDTVVEAEHAGRPAWEATIRPLPAYEPRCTCCSLLRSREVDLAEAWSGAGDAAILDDYPEAYRVRLDVGTGVCVLTEPIGGSLSASGHELQIEAVDEPIDDEMFRTPQPPRRLTASWWPRPGVAPPADSR